MEPEDLEDGEILDNEEQIEDIVDSYRVLERPSNYSSTLVQPRFREKDEEESEYEMTSPSDSDSDSCTYSGVKPKRIKYKLKPLAKNTKNTARKKNDIWSTRIQEDVLLENLVNCDVSQVDRSRNVETYPVPNFNTNRCKRSFDDRYQSNLRKNSLESENDVNGTSRTILDTHVTLADSEIDVANDIANKLYESNEDLILNIVTVIGKERALELFKKTKTIEESGGMMILDRSRRRTPGGVYLFLVKSDTTITPEQHKLIFNETKLSHKAAMRNQRKLKNKEIKKKIAAAKNKCEQNLPDLLNKSELCVNLAEVNDRSRRKSEVLDVKNPPPSPVTDVHENSSDDTDNIKQDIAYLPSNSINPEVSRNLLSYDDIADDFNMELF